MLLRKVLLPGKDNVHHFKLITEIFGKPPKEIMETCQDATSAPDIHREAVSLPSQHDLWSSVVSCGDIARSPDDWLCLHTILPSSRDHVDLAEIQLRGGYLEPKNLSDQFEVMHIVFAW
jgi:hypothetical protein